MIAQPKLQTVNDFDINFLTSTPRLNLMLPRFWVKSSERTRSNLGPSSNSSGYRREVEEIKFKYLLYCSRLVNAILTGITKRSGLFLEILECQLGATFYSMFYWLWLEQYNNNRINRVTNAMETVTETLLMETDEESGNTTKN